MTRSITLTVSLMIAALGVQSQNFETCDQWGLWDVNGYTIYNNIWGSGAGTQCLWAYDQGNWGIWADHPNTGGVKSYPNVAKPGQSHLISTMPTVTSSFNVTVPSSGWSGATTYDIWCGSKIEIMIWMNKQGAHGPWANGWDSQGNPIPIVSNVSVGGHTWNVYHNGNTRTNDLKVWSMIRTSNTTSSTVDLKACLEFLSTMPQFPLGDVVIDNYQFGFELTSSSGGLDFTCNSYSLDIGSDGGGGEGTTMHVQSIATGTQNAGQGKKHGTATITINDDLGNAVSSATITGTFSGTFGETVSGTTDSNGTVTMVTTATAKGGVTVDFCVDNVTHSSLSYNEPQNVITCTGSGARLSIAEPKPTAELSSDVLIYPNPSVNGDFGIEIPEIWIDSRLTIFDQSGKEFFTKKLEGCGTMEIQAGLKPGTYFVTISGDRAPVKRKLVVK